MRSFIQSHELFCVHTIKQQRLANKPLIIDDVSQHQHYYKPRSIRSDSPKARQEDWPENLPQKKTIVILKLKKLLFLMLQFFFQKHQTIDNLEHGNKKTKIYFIQMNTISKMLQILLLLRIKMLAIMSLHCMIYLLGKVISKITIYLLVKADPQ